MWIEVAQAFDHNETYNPTAYPAPASTGEKSISWSGYGLPYRGQPSIIYNVPFTVSATLTTAFTADYAGYGDPDGKDGVLRQDSWLYDHYVDTVVYSLLDRKRFQPSRDGS